MEGYTHDIVNANDVVNDLVWFLTILFVVQQKKKLHASPTLYHRHKLNIIP